MGFGNRQYPGNSGQPPRRDRVPALIFGGFCAAAVVVFVAITTLRGGTTTPAGASSTTAPAAVSTLAAASQAKAIAACEARPPASGDIYVRMLSPGVAWYAQRLGGEWGWDHVTGQCLTSVQLMIAAAPTVAGSCTQVGYVKDNPGWNPDATPARPLKVIAAQAGPGC